MTGIYATCRNQRNPVGFDLSQALLFFLVSRRCRLRRQRGHPWRVGRVVLPSECLFALVAGDPFVVVLVQFTAPRTLTPGEILVVSIL